MLCTPSLAEFPKISFPHFLPFNLHGILGGSTEPVYNIDIPHLFRGMGATARCACKAAPLPLGQSRWRGVCYYLFTFCIELSVNSNLCITFSTGSYITGFVSHECYTTMGDECHLPLVGV